MAPRSIKVDREKSILDAVQENELLSDLLVHALALASYMLTKCQGWGLSEEVLGTRIEKFPTASRKLSEVV